MSDGGVDNWIYKHAQAYKTLTRKRSTEFFRRGHVDHSSYSHYSQTILTDTNQVLTLAWYSFLHYPVFNVSRILHSMSSDLASLEKDLRESKAQVRLVLQSIHNNTADAITLSA